MRRLRPMTAAVEAERVAVGVEEMAVVAIDVLADDGADEPHFALGMQAVAQIELAGDVDEVGIDGGVRPAVEAGRRRNRGRRRCGRGGYRRSPRRRIRR